MGQSVTIVQVAQRAGVSISSVSRVINGNSRVDPAIAERVRAAVAELHYVPHVSARNLRGDKQRSIGFLVPRCDDGYFSEMLEAAVCAASDAGVSVSVFSAQGRQEEERRQLSAAVRSGVSGLLYCPVKYIAPELLYSVIPRGFPLVVVSRRQIVPGVPHVYHDNVRGAEDATRYLLMLNRRKIAFFAAFWDIAPTAEEIMRMYEDREKRGAYAALDRLDGYMRVLREEGLPLDPELIIPCDFTYAGGYRSANQLLGSVKSFDGILCGKDEQAAGVLQALNEQHISVPEKVSIVSTDDSTFSIVARPMLSTVKQFPRQLGARALDMCLRMLDGETVRDEVVEMELSVRNSTALQT